MGAHNVIILILAVSGGLLTCLLLLCVSRLDRSRAKLVALQVDLDKAVSVANTLLQKVYDVRAAAGLLHPDKDWDKRLIEHLQAIEPTHKTYWRYRNALTSLAMNGARALHPSATQGLSAEQLHKAWLAQHEWVRQVATQALHPDEPSAVIEQVERTPREQSRLGGSVSSSAALRLNAEQAKNSADFLLQEL